MLGKYNLNNLKMIESSTPSMYTSYKNKRIQIIIYANSLKGIQCIASLSLEQQSNGFYRNSGFSGAYYGFGELLYTMAFVELDKINKSLIADDRGLSDCALHFYEKLNNSNNISVTEHNNFKSYHKHISDEDTLIYNTLINNHVNNNLTQQQVNIILEQAYYLGEYMLPENNIIDRNQLFNDFKNGYPQFKIKKI